MALNNKQRRFVEEYLVDLNATQAAIRAGYSPKTAGQIGDENLKKPQIAAAVQEAQAERSKRTEITQDMVLRELAKIGFSDIRKLVRWGKTELRVAGAEEDGATEVHHGLALVSVDDIDDDTAAAIAEISEGREGLKVKLHDKKGALVDIGRHLGMFKDRIEHSGPNGGPIPIAEMTDEQLAAIAAGGRA
ncbi:terminase small subunit [Bordetella sp. 02P26C-1]|uniref:terminase small subunit n=1 Tax=Bordetella sp. 02P26C-1 TaxID=2683195 RepID=UPI001353701F|nr:terminase small subunit [Bordetella sp. 02P26C-1]MVW80189.1 terminase small subunit [Bordetella sp. 02P26C-1]